MSGALPTPVRAAALGTLAGRTCRALAEFDHPGVDRILQWDLRHAMRTVEVLAAHVTDTHRRDAVEAAADGGLAGRRRPR